MTVTQLTSKGLSFPLRTVLLVSSQGSRLCDLPTAASLLQTILKINTPEELSAEEWGRAGWGGWSGEKLSCNTVQLKQRFQSIQQEDL